MNREKTPLPPGRFCVEYRIEPTALQSAEEIAADVCLEQTVEVPLACVPPSLVERGFVGRVEQVTPVAPRSAARRVVISYLCELAVTSIPQFLNTLFGNISLKSSIRIDDFHLPHEMRHLFPGPSCGSNGVREILGVNGRPLTCTALKPAGLDADQLAQLAFEFASGGADIIKDDHGISNQRTAPFRERIPRVAEAIARANAATGTTTLYCPMLNGGCDELEGELEVCKACGVRGILAAPALLGFDRFAHIARRREFVLMAHPALSGTFFANPAHGATPALVLGKVFRLLGADISIFPNAGGRFPFTQQQCDDLCTALRSPLDGSKRALPAPAGGMGLERIGEMVEHYGCDTVLVIGGGLLHNNHNRVAATQAFRAAVADTARQSG